MKPRLFHCQLVDSAGHAQQETRLGLSRTHLLRDMQAAGLLPLTITPARRPLHYRWRQSLCSAFIAQLADLLEAGLPLLSALDLLADGHPYAEWRALIRQLRRAVAEGLALSQALRAQVAIFPPLYGRVLAAAEQSGALAAICRQLAQQQQQAQALRQRLLRALRYPLFLLAVALLIALGMLLTLLPQFALLYASLDAPLPWLTQRVLALADGIRQAWPQLMGGTLLALIALGLLHWRRGPQLRRAVQHLALRLPGYGPLLRDATLASLFQMLALMLQAGITLPAALTCCRQSQPLAEYRRALHSGVLRLRQGELLSTSLHDTRLFPPQCRQLIRQGEASGRLAAMCSHLGEYYRHSAQRRGETLATLAEPAMLLLSAALIALLVLAMYLPILQLGAIMH